MNDQILKTEIGEAYYTIQRMDAFTAWRTLASLQKSFAGPLARFFGGRGQGNSEDVGTASQGNGSQLYEAVTELSAKIDEHEFDRLCQQLLFKPECIAFSRHGDEPVRLRDMNKGLAITDMGDLLELIVAVLRHNYADFFTKTLSRYGLSMGPVNAADPESK